MNDRELLELAAKAAGVQIATWSNCQAGGFQTQASAQGKFWNPLTDDGDAFRLAVKLGMNIEIAGSTVFACSLGNFYEDAKPDLLAATRRAIVRAAAALASKGETV